MTGTLWTRTKRAASIFGRQEPHRLSMTAFTTPFA